MRLAAPPPVVDINRLTDLAYVRTEPDAVVIGALARHADVERDADARRRSRCCARRCGSSPTR